MFEPISIKNFSTGARWRICRRGVRYLYDDHGKEEVEDPPAPALFFEGGEGEPLILVHGIGQSLYAWRNNFEELANPSMFMRLTFRGMDFPGNRR